MIFSTLADLPKQGVKRIVLTLGIFDGVHVGHQTIIHALLDLAKKYHATPVAMTFSPHPRTQIQSIPQPLISTITQRIALLKKNGVQKVVVTDFTTQLAQLSPFDFLEKCTHVEGLEIVAIVVGRRWHFGKNAIGDAKFLTKYAQERGFIFQDVEEYCTDEGIVSSSKIRKHLMKGEMQVVERYLGRPYNVSGNVMHGYQNAKEKLDTPTANLIYEGDFLPPMGVYVAEVIVSNQKYHAIVAVGTSPTFDYQNPKIRIEAHCLDVSLSLYNQSIEVNFLKFLREEKKFKSIESLKQQIKIDIQQARQFFGSENK